MISPVRCVTRVALVLSLSAAAADAQSSFVNWETPHVHPLELTPDGGRLLAVNLADNRLEVFRLDAGLPVAEFAVPVGLDPVSVRARSNTEVWVVNQISDSVSVVDLERRTVVRTLDTEDEPADVVFAGAPERAFVTCSQVNTVLVFDPAHPALAPERIAIEGEDPRALAVSPDGGTVYAAVFESGNDTTILGGGIAMNLSFPPNVVSDPLGPYKGVNPPPNDGTSFLPRRKAGQPKPPPVSLIVRRDASGKWLDDNDGDWTDLVSGAKAGRSGRPVGWHLLDHDLAVIDANDLTVRYADHLMNICMALGVNPATGEVAVIGTEATNEVRFEPNLTGAFVRSHVALVNPEDATSSVFDLNPHLDYRSSSVPQAERDLSVADPRAIVWNRAGTRVFVAGMGSNNVIAFDTSHASTRRSVIEVGEGPTGLALDERGERLFVLNKFDASISVVDLTQDGEIARVPFYDPTPAVIQAGRKHLYDARATSGLGVTACGACHVDARMDGLAWDLGNPAGDMKSIAGQNLGGNIFLLGGGFQDWHPMKGPMVTQTLQDIIGKEPFHWRGDKDGLEEFNAAFPDLLGADELLSAVEMQEFESFLATIHFPPNPFRTLDNGLPTSLDLTGHVDPGLFGPAGTPLPKGNAKAGQAIYTPPRLLDGGGLACATCHTLPTGTGTQRRFDGQTFRAIALGPNGEQHTALVGIDGATNATMKVSQLRNLYEKTGFDATRVENTAGFGYFHDGSVDTIARFVTEPAFTLRDERELANLVAFLLSFSGSDLQQTNNANPLFPPGVLSKDAHAAVGKQVTLSAMDGSQAGRLALVDQLIALADASEIGLVAKGIRGGVARGWYYAGADTFASDRAAEVATKDELVRGEPGEANGITFTAVPFGSQIRIGVDRDEDGVFDRDELDAGSNPAARRRPLRVRAVGPRAASR